MHHHAMAWALLALAVPALPALAEDPIATDRPDFVESSQTVGRGRIQVETSVAWEKAGQAELTSTPSLLRMGVSEQWELRLETDGWLRTGGLAERASGMADLSVGAKYHVTDTDDAGPSLAWLIHADLPTGKDAFRGHGTRPSLRLVAEWELPQDYSLGLMPGVIRDSNESGDRYTAGIFGLVVGKAWNDRVRSFAEVAMPQIAGGRNGGTVAVLDLGSAWLLSNDVQVDVAYSAGLNDNAPDHALTVGLSARF